MWANKMQVARALHNFHCIGYNTLVVFKIGFTFSVVFFCCCVEPFTTAFQKLGFGCVERLQKDDLLSLKSP